MEREKLRIECDVREIEVNDDGECIYIPMDDNTFFKRVDNFLNWLEERQATLEKEEESRPKLKNDTPEAKFDMIKEAVELQARLSEEVCTELDKLFGEGCCRKVFVGVQSPSIILIWDFLDQLMPYLQKFARERNEKINLKYNKNRKAARGTL